MFARVVPRNICKRLVVSHNNTAAAALISNKRCYAAHSADDIVNMRTVKAVKEEVEVEDEGISLTNPSFPGTFKVIPSMELVNEEGDISKKISQTVMDNGFKIISTDSAAKLGSVVTLYVNAGTRHETFKTQGVSHYAQKFFYGPTNQRSALRLINDFQKTGAAVSAENGREEIVYRVDGIKQSVPHLLELVSNSVFQGRLHDYDLPPKRDAVKTDIQILAQSPELLLNEALHYKAFGNTLGNSIVCPPHNLTKISNKTVADFMNRFYVPERMTLVGTNVNHEDLVLMAKDFFMSQFELYNNAAEKQETSDEYNLGASTYIGGDQQFAETRDGNDITQSVLAFQGARFNPEDSKGYYANAILAELLGQGSNLYTASVTGKSTRLYQNVVSQLPQLVSAKSFNLAYSDNGLFGVHLITAGEGSGKKMTEALQRTVEEFKLIRDLTNDKQLEGARNRVLFQLAQSVESAAVLNEFTYKNGLVGVQAHMDVVKSISLEDVRHASAKLLQSKPTLISYGNLNGVATSADLSF